MPSFRQEEEAAGLATVNVPELPSSALADPEPVGQEEPPFAEALRVRGAPGVIGHVQDPGRNSVA